MINMDSKRKTRGRKPKFWTYKVKTVTKPDWLPQKSPDPDLSLENQTYLEGLESNTNSAIWFKNYVLASEVFGKPWAFNSNF